MRSPKGAAVIVGCLFVFLAFMFMGRHTERPRATGASIGSVSGLVGDADARPPGSLVFEKLLNDASVLSGEMIVVHEASQVTLGFGAASIRLQPGAKLVAERDPAHGTSAVLATLLDGDADVLTTSPQFRLMKNGREVVRTSEAPTLVKTGAAPEAAKPSSEVVVTASTPVETPVPVQTPVVQTGDETGDTASKDSLSNEEIRRALAIQSGFYRRCYLTYINRAKPTKTDGETVTVGFIIANSGKVREAKIVRSTVNDPVLTKCVLETVERTPFRAFKAGDIPVLEFPIELK